MASKSTKKASAPTSAPESVKPAVTATKTAAAKVAKIDKLFFLNAVKEGDKLAPQARVIVNVLAENDTSGTGVTRDDLVTALVGKLNTRQPEARILTYYQKTLVEAGYIKVETVETEVAAEATTEAAAE